MIRHAHQEYRVQSTEYRVEAHKLLSTRYLVLCTEATGGSD